MSASALPNEETWRRLAQAGLEGATVEKLIATTAEGLSIEPLFVERHLTGLSPRGLPGSPPFVRGPERGQGAAWTVAERLRVGDAHARARAAAAQAEGTEALWLEGDAGQPQEAWTALGQSVGPDVAVFCDAGDASPAAYEALTRGGARRVSALHDPVGNLALGREQGGAAGAWVAAARLCSAVGAAAGGPIRPLAASASLVHEAGGHAALEIGFALASLAEAVRQLEPLGVAPERVLASAALVVTAGVDQFAAIAKLRAIRLGYAKLAVALGVAAPPPPYVIGHVSRRAQARADAPTNYIRATIEVFALAVGGADVIVSRSFDDIGAELSALGVRVARSTELVLRDESHLGEVADAAGGSYYLESLTEGLARAGWEELRAIEREGGVVSSLASGAFAGRVRKAAEAAEAEVRKRRRVIVGTSDYAIAGEALPASAPAPRGASLLPGRLAEPFEAVRARTDAMARSGRRPVALLVRLGAPSEHRAREEFSRRFFEAGGFEVRAASLEDANQAARRGAADAFVLCGADARYAEVAVESTRELAGAGAKVLVLAGKPGALEPALRAAGLLTEIFLGCDAPKVLGAVLDGLAQKEVAS